ncbi:Hypothetical_protein [Hexamita inflata]|uniref:Hypothetical_protein n=1 Tax=Hexamita inflata TaxID=28002 RepID=A0AA86P9E1_9EUKA|nr:Hypothetical protein HINF_LOCUS22206 [Hexamita inflata]
MEFEFAQRVMWFMWLVQQYICSQVMKLGLPANIIQRLNYFRFKEELCVFIVLSAETAAASRSQIIQKQLEGKTIVYLQKHGRCIHLRKYKDIQVIRTRRGRLRGLTAADERRGPLLSKEQLRNQSTSLGQFIEHTKRDVWRVINVLVHLAVFGGARGLAGLGLVLVSVQFVEIVAFHLVVRPGRKSACYQLEVVAVLLHQLVQQGGFFFGPACYCSYHLLLKWQAHFQRLPDIENQRNVFALNMEFQFAQRVMWFMWLVQQYICSQVMKLGLPANIIQRLNYFRFKEELCVFIVLSAETAAASRSQIIQKQLEGKTIVYLQKHGRCIHLRKYKDIQVIRTRRGRLRGLTAADERRGPLLSKEQLRNQSTSLGQFIEHTKRDVWRVINVLVHLAVFGGARGLAGLGLVLVSVQFVEIVAFHLVVRPGRKSACYQLEVVAVLLHQLVQQGGFFFGPTCYCSYHLLLKWQAHFQRLPDIENQRNVFALNMEFEFAQRVMWFMWLVQQYICSQVMKLGLPANIIQRLNYFRFKEELCVFIVLSAETAAASRSQIIQKQLEGKTIVYLQKHGRCIHLRKYKDIQVIRTRRGRLRGLTAADERRGPLLSKEQLRNQSTSLGQFIEHTKRDVWGFINILVHLAVFGGARRLALLGLVLVFVQFVEIVAFHLVVRSGWKGACYQFEVVVVLLHQLVHQGGFFFGPTGYCSYHVTIEVVSVFLDAAGY